jgi:hypothetical protein
LIWGALSDERTGMSFTIAAALANAVIFGSEFRRPRGHILLSQIRDFTLRRLLRLAGSRWRYSTPPPHGSGSDAPLVFLITSLHGPNRKHLRTVPLLLHTYPLSWNVFTEPLPINGFNIFSYLAVVA